LLDCQIAVDCQIAGLRFCWIASGLDCLDCQIA